MLCTRAFTLATLILATAACAEELGAVEGNIVLHGTPVAGATVSLTRQLVESAPQSWEATTNASGHFSFKDVPPGEYAVGHMVKSEVRVRGWFTDSFTDSYRRHIIVEPGKHVVVPPYPEGHKLSGRMVLRPGSTYDVAWQGEDMRHIYSPRISPKIPKGLTPEEEAKRYEEFRQTRKFKDDWVTRTRIVLNINPDGTFHAFDVPPGKYELVIDVGSNVERKRDSRPAVAFTSFKMPNKDFTLPDIQVNEPGQQTASVSQK